MNSAEKDELRYKLKVKRRYMGEIVRLEADRTILEEFIQSFSNYKSFFIYNGFSTEARTDMIISYLLESGKRVYLPRVEGREIVAVPYFGGECPLGAYGIAEPCGEPFSGDIEVTVIPLLAVNGRGYRIGYGGGFYDRYLKGKNTLKVGMGYGFQMEEFKEEPFDVPLDKYLCERGIYDFVGK